MLESLDETIKQLLIQKVPLNQSEVDISFDVPNREWSGTISKPTLNVYLYDIRENLNYAVGPMERRIERTLDGRITKTKPGNRYNISYLITAWTTNVEDEHRLLWYVLSTLYRYNYLPDDILQEPLASSQPYPMLTSVAHPEGILRNVADVWTALDNQLKPVLPYVITVYMDNDISETVGMVKSKFIRFEPPPLGNEEQAAFVARNRGYALDGSSEGNGYAPVLTEELVQIGGHITDTTRPEQPVRAEVILLEQGLNARTDRKGRYTFTNLARRPKYTVLVVAPGYKTFRQEFTIPAASYDFALEPEAEGS